MAEEHEKEPVKKAAAKKRDKDEVRTRRHVRAEEEKNVMESGQAVHSLTLNPDDQPVVNASLVVGADTEDDGELEFHPEHFEGVSQDRLFKAATSHGYPVLTDAEADEAEMRRAEIDEHNAKLEEEREAHHEAEEKAARKRLTDFLKG